MDMCLSLNYKNNPTICERGYITEDSPSSIA
jgi:hypothetical protein